jgi:penicillin-binding protein 2
MGPVIKRIRFSWFVAAIFFVFWPAGSPAARGAAPPSDGPSATSTVVRHYRYHSRYRRHRVRRYYRRSRWTVPTYTDPTAYDHAQFDDPLVRQAAVEALGDRNGSVVAIDPNTGRILTIVNQPLAFSAGFEPCSTFKPVVALAALEQGVITPTTKIRVGRRYYVDLTEALAHSNNAFFEALGRRLGFDTLDHYAHLFGLGEAAGYDIPGEQPGTFPAEAPPAKDGGVAKLSSFGEGIRITPLQLATMISTLANGGYLYWLQYPQTAQQAADFVPRLKRKLEITPYAAEIQQGMLAAVEYGTARMSFDPFGEQTLGKTGTCSDQGGRLGWFVSYADQQHPQIVLVVLLRGSTRLVNGPRAADIAGRIYRSLYEHNFFAENERPAVVPARATATTP